jgi:hypothetical protein
MARPPRHALSSRPSAAHSRRLPNHALLRAGAAFFLATLVALPLAVLHRAALSRHSLEHSWGWDALPSVAAYEEDGAQGEDLVSPPPPFSIYLTHLVPCVECLVRQLWYPLVNHERMTSNFSAVRYWLCDSGTTNSCV